MSDTDAFPQNWSEYWDTVRELVRSRLCWREDCLAEFADITVPWARTFYRERQNPPFAAQLIVKEIYRSVAYGLAFI